MLVFNKTLELLGLAKCSIYSIDQLQGLIDCIGKFTMNNDEIEDFKIKEKEKEAIVSRN